MFIKEELLAFTSRIPDGSVNFTINGIDLNLISSDRYFEALWREIARATEPGGVVFGVNASDMDSMNELYGFERFHFGSLNAYRKPMLNMASGPN